jgi:3'(2'), 5'-bisphosphate nucleotidase
MYEHELTTALLLANAAAERIIEIYASDFTAEQKLGVDDHYEPVTAADKEASRIIVAGLTAEFPEDAVLSEEETDNTDRRQLAKRVWIVDPIDGTAGFIKKDGDFAVQIGLADSGIAAVGVVLLPFYKHIYYASKGSGSFSKIRDGDPVRLQTSAVSDPTKMSAAVSRHHPSARTSQIIEHFGFGRVIRRGSVGLKVGLIADRSCDIYIHPSPRTKLWDTCAPQIILEEAGGRFTDIFGGEYRYDRRELRNLNGILATNGASHDNAVERLKPLLREFDRQRVELADPR